MSSEPLKAEDVRAAFGSLLGFVLAGYIAFAVHQHGPVGCVQKVVSGTLYGIGWSAGAVQRAVVDGYRSGKAGS